ncbi:glycosyltransferase family 2 protein [Baudoinia panamericana UAMH 10762]|uniref:Glycosyltransferase family 2 protein n=1 Tax=Baudoinia panamericana (strain UAMH 10762) TaxID=717646 RepID=M2LRT9_BAUPA|nr:glycosyltransferase family 2 protein [Baudoinia panamericana UAMH 10762]EMC97187.1 glycosyltransferase family 2 protein [Baudoinia panamericana UAMH 10762]
MLTAKRLSWGLMPPTALLALTSMLAYFGFRIYTLVYAQALRALAWRPPNRPRRRLSGDNVPTVDVLITCCNEDIDVILDTVRAACLSDYPQDRFRVFLCDDGRSESVYKSVVALRETYPNINYTSRPKPDVPDYKAGNLNNVASPSEYVAGLDADMICMPHWLRAQLPHLIDDPSVAMTCPPQTFYDTPTNDPLTQNMLQFAGLTEAVNDSLGHADCLGSGYVVRRTAVEGIGGFPVESVSEDVCCSAKLLGAGWKTVFVQEFLQYGSVPESYYAHVKQRTRWWVGHIQTAILFRFRTSRKYAKHLNLVQRLTGITFDLRQWVQIPLALSYFFVPLALYAGYPLVIWTSAFQLQWLIRLICIWATCHWIHQMVMGWIAGIGNGRYDIRITSYDAELEQWLLPYVLSAFVQSFLLPKRLGGRSTGFKSTGSILDALHERDAQRRAHVFKRLYAILWVQRGIFHAVFVVVCLGGVALTCIRSVYPNISSAYPLTQTTYGNQLIYLVTRIGWPPLVWLQFLQAALVPPLYAIFPPSVKPREELLDRDPKTNVAYPKPMATRLKRSAWDFWRYMRASLAMVYCIFLFTISWFLFGTNIASDQHTSPW